MDRISVSQSLNSDNTPVSKSPFPTHDYDVPYCFKATAIERKTKNGYTVYEFTNGTSETYILHTVYDKHAYTTMPPGLADVQPQQRTPCTVNVFWCWRKATGNMQFDAKRIIDVQRRNDSPPGKNYQKRLEDMKKAACKAAVVNVAEFRNERDYWWEGDTNVYPWEGEMSELIDWFGPKENRAMPKTIEDELTAAHDEQKDQDKPAANDWIDNPKFRGKFYGSWNNIADAHNIPDDERERFLYDVAGVSSLHDYTGKGAGLLADLKTKAEEKYPIENKPVEAPVSNVPAIGTQTTTEERTEAAPASVEPANVIPFVPPANLPRTLTGVSILNIGKELNKHLPAEAYGAIKFGQMTGRTDIDGDAVRDRFDQVFGPLMWRIVPQQLAGRVEYSTETRANSKGTEQTWHICTLVAHQFQYALIMPDGSLQWVDGMVTSDLHDNTDQQYCYRGAVTSIMKQFYRLMGGMNHIIYGEYTHEHAAREIAARKRSA